MKYIKSFESITPMFWRVPTKMPDLEIALWKIPFSSEKKKDIHVFTQNDNITQFDYIYVSTLPYSWMPDRINNTKKVENVFKKEEDGKEYFEREGRIYQGTVTVTQDEIDNFDVFKKMDVYNL